MAGRKTFSPAVTATPNAIDRVAMAALLRRMADQLDPPASRSTIVADGVEHDPAFTRVIWAGRPYHFLCGQQTSVIRLFIEGDRDQPGRLFTSAEIALHLKSEAEVFRLQKIFIRNGKLNPGYRALIEQISRGVYRLRQNHFPTCFPLQRRDVPSSTLNN